MIIDPNKPEYCKLDICRSGYKYACESGYTCDMTDRSKAPEELIKQWEDRESLWKKI